MEFCPDAIVWGNVGELGGAIATFLAVIAALVIPWLSVRAERKRAADEERVRAEIVAMTIAPKLFELQVHAQMAKQAVLGMERAMRESTVAQVNELLRITTLIPDVQFLPQLGRQIGMALANLHANIEAVNKYVDDSGKLGKELGPSHPYFREGELLGIFGALHDSTRRAADALNTVLPYPLDLEKYAAQEDAMQWGTDSPPSLDIRK